MRQEDCSLFPGEGGGGGGKKCSFFLIGEREKYLGRGGPTFEEEEKESLFCSLV